MFDTLLQDIRFGFRTLLKNPGLTGIAVLSLALGIGANTTIFSWVQAVLLRPLPGVSDPDSLVVLATKSPSGSPISCSYPDFVDFRDHNEVFSGVTTFDMQAMSLSDGGRAERVYGAIVSGNYFDVLGVAASPGRTFLPEEDRDPGSHAVAVISHGLWQRRFNSDPGLLNRTVTINGHPFTIVGIAPENFGGTVVGLGLDIWVPMMMQQQVVPGDKLLEQRGNRWLQSLARLKPGVTISQAESSINTVAGQLAQEYPRSNEGMTAALYPLWNSPWGAGFLLKPVLLVMTAVVGLVLLIACANVANLLLSKAVGRRKEIAIRLALGASRLRLIRQLMTESVLLALVGGLGGLLVAYWGAGLLLAFAPTTDIPVKLATDLDGRILIFTLVVSVLTGLIFGLAPALQTSNPNLINTLKDAGGRSGGGQARSRLRNLLVVFQVALSLLLLICAGLFLKSLKNGQTLDPGFNPNNMLLVSYDLFPNGYTPERGTLFHDQMVERIKAMPGVESATVAHRVPLGFGGSSSSHAQIDGYQPRPGEEINIFTNNVGLNYFATMGIPLTEGREFTAQDNKDSNRVAVINQTMARRYWGDRDPLGSQIRIGDTKLEVVGVARDGKYQFLGEDPKPFMYMPIAQSYRSEVVLQIRTSGPPEEMLPAVRQEVRAMDPDLPLYEIKSMTDHLAISVFPQRIAATLLGILGMLALVLASVGLYGVITYSVSQRTHEIGIRMALGARTSDVLKLVVRQGMMLALIGVAIGLLAAFGLTRFLSSLLYGVSATDLITFLATPLLLSLVAFIATLIPARRAAKVDPMTALRYE